MAYYVVNKVSESQIIDARPANRYNGEVEEPRAGVRKGHIPGAKNLFFGDVIDPETQTLKSDKELAKIFLSKNIDT